MNFLRRNDNNFTNTSSSSSSTRVNHRLHCSECDEYTDDINASSSSSRPSGICLTCGSPLRLVLSDQISEIAAASAVIDAINTPTIGGSNANNGNVSYLHSILELIDVSLHNQILEALNQVAPSRQISVSYLQSLGKVTVDSEKLILRDISLTYGPLQVLAVSASFGSIQSDVYQIENRLVLSNPIHGQSKLINHESCREALVVFQRGEVSFTRKCMHALEAGVSAVVIIQTSGMWPFVMTDTADELAKNCVTMDIPVVMISKTDGELLTKLLEEGAKLNKKRRGNSSTESSSSTLQSAVLRFGHSSIDCSICQDPFEVDQSVYKLPCRHVYHVDCVTSWLQQRNTCPLCRLELPKEEVRTDRQSNNRSNHSLVDLS